MEGRRASEIPDFQIDNAHQDAILRGQVTADAKLNAGIFYRTYGSGPTKVFLIIRLAGAHDSWGPQIHGLTGIVILNDDQRVATANCSDNEAGFGSGSFEVYAFDNRGMGRSSIPTKKSE
ncbi:hypothetical protein ACFX2C_028406 [Malus domestica]